MTNKYSYFKVVQGYYNGWEDLTFSDNKKEARQDLKDYRDNCVGMFRIISRRVLND